jgi:hypothetical protein
LALAAAAEIGPDLLDPGQELLLKPPARPGGPGKALSDYVSWVEAYHAALFEVWYHVGARALPALRAIAFGPYDWTQADATRVLCRLALQGLETDLTAQQIADALPNWRYEQVLRTCEAVATLAARSPALQAAYDQQIEAWANDNPVDALELVAQVATFSPDHARARFDPFLRAALAGGVLEGRTEFAGGGVFLEHEDGKLQRVDKGSDLPQDPEYHRIRAAVVLRRLFPADESIRLQLQHWAAHYPDPGVRDGLGALLRGVSEVTADPSAGGGKG